MMAFPVLMVSLYICIFVVGVSLLAKIIPNYRRPEIFWLILFVASVCIISFCSLNVYVIEDFELKASFSRWRFIGHGIIGPTWFFFFMLTFSKAKIFKSPFLIVPLAIVMIVTLTLAIVPGLGSFLLTDFSPIQIYGTKLVKFSNGPWFAVHIIVAYLCAITTIVYTMLTAPFTKRAKRKQLIILSTGVLVGLIADTYCVLNDSPLRWAMLSGGAYLITEGSILYAITRHSLFELSSVAKNQIFQGMSDPVIILDQNKILVDSNDQAKKIFKLEESYNYKPVEQLVVFKTVDFSATQQDWTFVEDKGEKRFYRITAESLKNYSGKILFFRDTTTHKKLESSLNAHLDFKAQLLEIMAHDFSGVLSAQSQLSSQLEKRVSPELRENALDLSNSTHSAKDLLQNILLWSRAQENRFHPIKKPYEMKSLLYDVVNNLESVWKAKDLKIKINSNERALGLTGDTIMVESVVRNILSNAIRASFRGEEINLTLFSNRDRAILKVQDKGTGMSSEKLKKIENATQTFSTKEVKSADGFGIGLIVARRFVEMHDGELDFKSEAGRGTLVTISLPL